MPIRIKIGRLRPVEHGTDIHWVFREIASSRGMTGSFVAEVSQTDFESMVSALRDEFQQPMDVVTLELEVL